MEFPGWLLLSGDYDKRTGSQAQLESLILAQNERWRQA